MVLDAVISLCLNDFLNVSYARGLARGINIYIIADVYVDSESKHLENTDTEFQEYICGHWFL